MTMKEWQKGYDIDYLKSIEAKFNDMNEKIISPFMQMKKNKVAEYLANDELILNDDFDVLVSQSSKPSKIKVYSSKKHILAIIEPNEIELSYAQIRNLTAFKSYIDSLKENVWLIWLDEDTVSPIPNSLGFVRIGGKFNSFGDAFGVYFLEKKKRTTGLFEEPSPICLYTEKHETACALKFKNIQIDVEPILKKLEGFKFANHYSNYNGGGGWGAISLRGYSPDPGFIIKPLEMNDKWHEKNKDKEFHIQDTEVYESFPEVREIIQSISKTARVDRVRIMKLEGGKIIEKHTDLVDTECGIEIGEVPRFHIPLITHDNCWFEVYGMNGKETFKMKVGELWYLDTRKPHRVVNQGETRVHLVFDLYTDESLLDKLRKDTI